jgi:hypothetical protein
LNLSTWYTFCPQKMYYRSLLLLGAILKFCCHVHCFVVTLTLTARSTSLPCPLVTWHPTIPPPPPPPPLPLFIFFFLKKYRSAENFEDPSY